MRIKDLPKDLQKLALDNQYKQNGECDKNKSLDAAFDWHHTPEGIDFWGNVYDGNYNKHTTPEYNKPTQYKIGIDTFERAKANLTKEELLACCRFNIDKYTWRKKDQDKSDFEKIIAYATYAIENGF
jgi:hypothetical protein